MSRRPAKASISRTTSRIRWAWSVHDVGEYRGAPFVPGQAHRRPDAVGSDERLYIRCEDTVVVTEDGIENLTGFVPIDPREIEAVIAEPGLLQSYTPR